MPVKNGIALKNHGMAHYYHRLAKGAVAVMLFLSR
jgi:hypothetical protein